MGANDPQSDNMGDNLITALVALRSAVNQMAQIRALLAKYDKNEISSWEVAERLIKLVGLEGDESHGPQGSERRQEIEGQVQEGRHRTARRNFAGREEVVEVETVPPAGNSQMLLPVPVSRQPVWETDATPQPGQEDDGPAVHGV